MSTLRPRMTITMTPTMSRALAALAASRRRNASDEARVAIAAWLKAAGIDVPDTEMHLHVPQAKKIARKIAS